MKKMILPIIILRVTQLTHADDSTDFFDGIAGEFFQPYSNTNMTKIEGSFNTNYFVQPEDNIPYEVIKYFGWPENYEYGIKYFSFSFRTNKEVKDSIIEIYRQQFSLGFLRDEVDGSPRQIMPSSGEFWTFEYNGKTFLSYITHQAGANAWYAKHALLFDITDKKNVQFHIYDTEIFGGYQPQLYMHGGRLFIFITGYTGSPAKFYSLDTYEKLVNENGDDIEFAFSYDKWGGEGNWFQYLGSNFPNRFQE